MSALNPTLAGAVAKAERGIAFLKLPGATSDHLRQAMDCLKSTGKLAASHHTVLVELEDQVPEPGPALFDSTGAPVQGAELAAPITSDEAILQMTGADYEALPYGETEPAESDLLFAARMHFRARGFSLERWRAFSEQMTILQFNAHAWDWVIQQIRESGDFEWPHRCPGGCGELELVDEDGKVEECWSCKNNRLIAERKAAKKAEKPKAPKKAKPAPPAPDPELLEEGGDA
jgi:hypothetical protein